MYNKSINFYSDHIDTSFIETEIKNLTKYFNFVNVYTFKKPEKKHTEANLKIHVIDFNDYKTSKAIIKNTWLTLKVLSSEILKTRVYFKNISILKKIISEWLRCNYVAEMLFEKEKNNSENNIYYTFWLNDWSTILSIAKNKKYIPSFYSRCHGADLYEERIPITRKIPFRTFQLNHVDKLFTVSKKGALYLKNKYPKFKTKILSQYLGIENNFQSNNNKSEVFTIVSCSEIRNLKRVYLVAEALTYINSNVKWIHIGYENKNDNTYKIFSEQIEKLKSKENIQIELKGFLDNNEVMEFYYNTPVDLFVSASQIEGLPVSMMEAISFGIPVISTDVGGCEEIVNSITGVLIEKNFNPKELAEIIEDLTLNYPFNKYQIKNFWHNNFNNDSNFTSFLEQII